MKCVRETSNHFDPFAVAVVKDTIGTVGHVPKRIFALCSLFIRRGGSISCTVDGDRRYSRDLPQGGLEIPCILTFTAKEQSSIDKIVALLKGIEDITTRLASGTQGSNETSEESKNFSPPSKVLKLTEKDLPHDISDDDESEKWIRFDADHVLTIAEKDDILQNRVLNDRVINFSLRIMQDQFPSLVGLASSLILPTLPQSFQGWKEKFLQICHCQGHHWITVTTKGCKNGELMVYDSLYDSIDSTTASTLERLFNTQLIYKMADTQKQQGVIDCGVFAIANATAVALCADTETPFLQFEQQKICEHLVYCLHNKFFCQFPAHTN